MSTLEWNYNMRNLTHEFIATHLHHESSWPHICLKDSGPHLSYPYVGYVATDWFYQRQKLKDQALPHKILFCELFLSFLPSMSIGPQLYTDEMQQSISDYACGNLKWYMTFHPGTLDTPEIQFVHCTVEGHRFSWNLVPQHKESCEKRCHTIGLWRD